MNETSRPLIELDDSLEVIQEFFETQGWTDGLPIVPPTPERVGQMYRYAQRAPGDIVARLVPREGEATVERIAINAVMAGCRPEYMPVLVTAIQAVAEPRFNLSTVQATTHPCAVLVLVNGPIGRELKLNGGSNCFGQGSHANATIGRAIRLILMNVGGGTPPVADRATQGTPAKYSFCVAENEEENPWEPFHVEHGYAPDDSTVSVLPCEGPHNVQDRQSISGVGLLTTMAATMRAAGNNNIHGHGGEPLVAFCPEHAAAIARDGYTKDAVKQFLWEHARLPRTEWSPDWQSSESFVGRLQRDTGQHDWTPVTRHWSDINVIVAGGAGKHSSWLPTVGFQDTTVTRRIELPDGTPLRSVADARRS